MARWCLPVSSLAGVRPAAVTVMVLGQGTLSQTNGDLDVAIDGLGCIPGVTMPSGISAYTRDGASKRSTEGQVVTSDGYPLVPDITIPEDARSIAIGCQWRGLRLFQRPRGAGKPGPDHAGEFRQ